MATTYIQFNHMDGLRGMCYSSFYRERDGRIEAVHVAVHPADCLPTLPTSSSDEIVRIFDGFPESAGHSWATLGISRGEDGTVRAMPNAWPPHRLEPNMLPGNYPTFNYLELHSILAYNDRVERVDLNGRPCILKVARHPRDIGRIAREIQIYHVLTQRRSTACPRFLGYAYEGTTNRMVGFLCEDITGHHPRPGDINDLKICDNALNQLHAMGITHGDINRSNIIITYNGHAKYIDFERGSILTHGSESEWRNKKYDDSLEVLSDRQVASNGMQGASWSAWTRRNPRSRHD